MGADNTFGETNFNLNKWTPEPWSEFRRLKTLIPNHVSLKKVDYERARECVNALALAEKPKEYIETILNQREELAEQVDLLQKGMEFCMKQRQELAEQVKKLTKALDQANGYIERNSVGL